jgi:hypothetical protein
LDAYANSKGLDAYVFDPIASDYLLVHDDHLEVRTPYSRTVVEALREVPFASWDPDHKLWRIPYQSYEAAPSLGSDRSCRQASRAGGAKEATGTTTRIGTGADITRPRKRTPPPAPSLVVRPPSTAWTSCDDGNLRRCRLHRSRWRTHGTRGA